MSSNVILLDEDDEKQAEEEEVEVDREVEILKEEISEVCKKIEKDKEYGRGGKFKRRIGDLGSEPDSNLEYFDIALAIKESI